MLNVERLRREGIRYLSSLVPTVHVNILALFMELAIWGVIAFAVTMIIVEPYGIVNNFLYSGLRLPVLWNLQLLAEYPQALDTLHNWISPEQSLHWTTAISVALMLEFFMIKLPKRGFTVLHTVAYSILVAFASLVFPFEWAYTTLYDVFHNYPATGAFQLTFYGTWNIAQGKIFDSVIGRNGFMALCLVFAWIVGQDAMNGKLKLHFDRVSKFLSVGVIASFTFWILLPVIFPSVFVGVLTKGTIWFPQDIYVWYGPAGWSQYPDIIKEVWVPGGIGANYLYITSQFVVDRFYFALPPSLFGPIVRITNEITKAISTIWVAWIFLPKEKLKSVESPVVGVG